MKIEKEHILGIIMGLIPVVILYFVLEYRPFNKANQTSEQERSMPAISDSYEASLDDIRLVELQIEAVTIDMHLYLGWFPEKKEMLKKASVKAIDDLINIKNYLNQLKFTNDLTDLKDISISALDSLVKIYDGIELKSLEDIGAEFASFNEMGVTRLPLCCCIVS